MHPSSTTSWWERVKLRVTVIGGVVGILSATGAWALIDGPVLMSQHKKVEARVLKLENLIRNADCKFLRADYNAAQILLEIRLSRQAEFEKSGNGVPLEMQISIRQVREEISQIKKEFEAKGCFKRGGSSD